MSLPSAATFGGGVRGYIGRMTLQPLDVLTQADFVALTSFRRTGEGVSTPVWIAGDGSQLLVLTPTDTGKVKRIRNTPAVELLPCSRRGAVADGLVPVAATAEIVDDPTEVRRYREFFRAKYGVEFSVVMFIERILARRQKPRVILRLTLR